MIIGSTFSIIVNDLESRKSDKSKDILLVFVDDIQLRYYKNYFRGNKNIILKSFDSIKRRGLFGLRYREYFVLNFITSIEEIKNEIEALISDLERED